MAVIALFALRVSRELESGASDLATSSAIYGALFGMLASSALGAVAYGLGAIVVAVGAAIVVSPDAAALVRAASGLDVALCAVIVVGSAGVFGSRSHGRFANALRMLVLLLPFVGWWVNPSHLLIFLGVHSGIVVLLVLVAVGLERRLAETAGSSS